MLAMGVPEKLLRKLDREKEAVAAFNVAKKKEDGKRTHKRLTIVAGTLARRKLLSPSGLDTRPMMGMVRGATFDMIMSAVGSRSNVAFPTDDARWLDLFAGTGALGIEALSRGAARAVFVECSRMHAALVEENLATCGFSDRADVVVADARTWLAANPGPWDLALLDPPYAFDDWPALLVGLDAGLAVAESDREFGQIQSWHVERVRRYAGTVVTLLLPKDGDPGSYPP